MGGDEGCYQQGVYTVQPYRAPSYSVSAMAHAAAMAAHFQPDSHQMYGADSKPLSHPDTSLYDAVIAAKGTNSGKSPPLDPFMKNLDDPVYQALTDPDNSPLANDKGPFHDKGEGGAYVADYKRAP